MSFKEVSRDGVVFTASRKIEARHGFMTRLGGVSQGIYSTMNVGVNLGDSPECVEENIRRVCRAIGADSEKAVFSRQVHRDGIRVCTPSDCRRPGVPVPYEADGLITDIPGLVLFIFTADCTPILLYDPVKRCIGAVHAGWRGTAADIAGKAVRKMCEVFSSRPEDIRGAIGPCISLCCFETGEDVERAMAGLMGKAAEKFVITGNNGKFMTDLKGINSWLLERAGVLPENIDISPECTMCKRDKYWSHRATDGKRGVQASCITLD